MNEQYFFVRKLGLGKEVVSLSLVATDVSRGGHRSAMMKTGGWFEIILKKDLERLLRLLHQATHTHTHTARRS